MQTNNNIARRGKWIAFWLAFWTRVAVVTRFGIHGFVLWRIRRAYEKAVEYNRMATAHNRRERKERRREIARLNGGMR